MALKTSRASFVKSHHIKICYRQNFWISATGAPAAKCKVVYLNHLGILAFNYLLNQTITNLQKKFFFEVVQSILGLITDLNYMTTMSISCPAVTVKNSDHFTHK